MALGFTSKITSIVDAHTPTQITQSGGLRVVKDLRIENVRTTAYYNLTESDAPSGSSKPYLRTYFDSQSGYVYAQGSDMCAPPLYKTVDDTAGVVFMSYPEAMYTFGHARGNDLLIQLVDSTTGEVWEACELPSGIVSNGIRYIPGYSGNYDTYRIVVDWADANKTHLLVQIFGKAVVVKVDRAEKTLTPVVTFSLFNGYSTITSTATDFTFVEFGPFGSTALQYKTHTFNPSTNTVTSASTSTSMGVSLGSLYVPVFARRANPSANEFVLVYSTSTSSVQIAHASIDFSSNAVSWSGAAGTNVGSWAGYCEILPLSTGSDFAYSLVIAQGYGSWSTAYPSVLVFGTALETNPSITQLHTYTGGTGYYLYAPTLMSLGGGYYALGAQNRYGSGSYSGCYILQKGSSSLVGTVYNYNAAARMVGAVNGAVYHTSAMTLEKTTISGGSLTTVTVTDPSEFAIGVHIPALTGKVRDKTYVYHPHRGHLLFDGGTLFKASASYADHGYIVHNIITSPEHVAVKWNQSTNASLTSQSTVYFRLYQVREDGVFVYKYSNSVTSYPAAADMAFDSAGLNFYFAYNSGTSTGYFGMYKVPLSTYSASNIYGTSNASYPYTGAWFFDDTGELLFYRGINNSYQIWDTTGKTVSSITVNGNSIGTSGTYATVAGGVQVFDGTTTHKLSFVSGYIFYQTITNDKVTTHAITSYGANPYANTVFVTRDLNVVKWVLTSGSSVGLHIPSGASLPVSAIDAHWTFCDTVLDEQPGITHYKANSGTFTIEYIPVSPVTLDFSISSNDGSAKVTKGVVVAPGDVVALADTFYLGAGEDIYVESDTRRAVVVYSVVLDNA